MPLILLDGDMLVFRALVGSEREMNWGDHIWTLHTNIPQAWDKLDRRLTEILKQLPERDQPVLVFSGDHNFRKGLEPSYKGNRAGSRKPLGYAEVVEAITTKSAWGHLGPRPQYGVVQIMNLEGDDAMGILATKPGNHGSIIVSDDKDMKTIPGFLWRYAEKQGEGVKREILTITGEEADYWHMFQTLTGDVTDGYRGCPGLGPVLAEEMLKERLKFSKVTKVITRGKNKGTEQSLWEKATSSSPWETVCSCFERAGLSEDDALLQARLARILRWTDWNTQTKEPKLWTP